MGRGVKRHARMLLGAARTIILVVVTIPYINGTKNSLLLYENMKINIFHKSMVWVSVADGDGLMFKDNRCITINYRTGNKPISC